MGVCEEEAWLLFSHPSSSNLLAYSFFLESSLILACGLCLSSGLLTPVSHNWKELVLIIHGQLLNSQIFLLHILQISISVVVKILARQSSLVLNHNVRVSHNLWALGETPNSLLIPLQPVHVNFSGEQKKLHFLAHLNISSLCKELTVVYKPPHVSLYANMFTALKLLSRDMSKHPWGLAALPSSWLQLCAFHCCIIWNHHKSFFVFILPVHLWGGDSSQIYTCRTESWL